MPLTDGAYAVLLGSIVDAAPRLQEMGVEASPDALLQELELPLYLTLGAAQKEAADAGGEIDAIAVRRGGVRFFSLGWPFCCATP
jgi:hypothetical protein